MSIVLAENTEDPDHDHKERQRKYQERRVQFRVKRTLERGDQTVTSTARIQAMNTILHATVQKQATARYRRAKECQERIRDGISVDIHNKILLREKAIDDEDWKVRNQLMTHCSKMHNIERNLLVMERQKQREEEIDLEITFMNEERSHRESRKKARKNE